MEKLIKGTKKIRNDLNKYLNSAEFKLKISELRKKYEIPQNGIEPKIDSLGNKRIAVFAPREWVHYRNKQIYKELSEYLREAITFPLTGLEWDIIFQTFLFFGHIPEAFLVEHLKMYNLCKISDVKAELDEYDLSNLINPVKNEQEKAKTYPIVLRISPYASQNVITNFISKNKDLIEKLQNKYKGPEITLGKTRYRPATKKHNFIWKNKKKSRPEITKLVKKKFGNSNNEDTVKMAIWRKKRGV